MARLTDNTKVSTEEIEAKAEELAKKLEILRVRYEQYFIGVEKVAPATLRMEVVRILRELEQLNVRNTAVKFKIRQLSQKFTSFSTYWNRTLREIEDGTYKRHLDRLKRHQAAAEEKVTGREPSVKKEQPAANAANVSSVSNEAEEFLASLGMGGPAKQSSAAPKPSGPPAFHPPIPSAPAAKVPVEGQQTFERSSKPAIIAAAKPGFERTPSKPAIAAASAVHPSVPKQTVFPAVHGEHKEAASHHLSSSLASSNRLSPPTSAGHIVSGHHPSIVSSVNKPVSVTSSVKPGFVTPSVKPSSVTPSQQTVPTGAVRRPTIVHAARSESGTVPPATVEKHEHVQPPAPQRPAVQRPTVTPRKPLLPHFPMNNGQNPDRR